MNCHNNKKNATSVRERAQLLPGKEAVLVVLAAWIQQLFCTVSAPVVHCRKKNVKGERKRNSAVLWTLSRIRVTITLVVTQCVSSRVQRGEKHVPFLLSRDILFQHSCCCWRAIAQRLCLCIHLSQCMLHGW